MNDIFFISWHRNKLLSLPESEWIKMLRNLCCIFAVSIFLRVFFIRFSSLNGKITPCVVILTEEDNISTQLLGKMILRPIGGLLERGNINHTLFNVLCVFHTPHIPACKMFQPPKSNLQFMVLQLCQCYNLLIE